MQRLDPALQQRVGPILERWQGFVTKVDARLAAVLAEAQTGLDALIAQATTDANALGTALQAVQSRFHGIDRKVDEAWDKISEELDAIRDEVDDDDDRTDDADDVLYELYYAARKQAGDLREKVDMQWNWLEMRKQADWARALYAQVQAEAQQPVSCSQCGAPVERSVWWQASNVTCPHCGAVSTVDPGTATAMFYAGIGGHAMAHEQAWNDWMAEQTAKTQLDGFRHASASDHANWLNAARAYWTRYYQVTAQYNPGFTQPVAEAVEARIAQYVAHEPAVEQIHRDFFERLCQGAAQQNPAALQPILSALPNGVDLDDCAECLVEHGFRAGAVTVLERLYVEDEEDDPKDAWIREKMADIRRTLSD